MRISGDPQHPDYNAAMLPADVYLNGEQLSGCIFADDDAGEAICYAPDKRGAPYLVGDEIATEVKRGHIRIEKMTEPGPDGFDAWMRDRTETAHAAYMARHCAGGKAF
ncbi:hypothetical protein CR152_11495 [Massilia violaceinigra]|uniref:Uncharacterized protein n=1 Tax=Massilia violaceinigra TaxID=2045208 RepID=A0A2D2DJD3_9BURK|nr:hypothetical protein [Massilia violaceinigra]ATQ75075.1 hypothetical protein CR152_11495 [Massilia violaceinigra]